MTHLNISDIAGKDESGVPIRGNPPIFFGIGAVAFIDLLGFSDAILTEWGSSENSPLFKILRVKNNPTIKENKSVTIILCTPPTSNSPEIKHSYFNTKIHTVSDSITISFAFSDNDTHDDMLCKFNSLLIHLRFIVQAAIDEGFIIRGGVEIGNIYWSDSEIIGPALINAYVIESKIAKIARVILGPRLLELLIYLDPYFKYIMSGSSMQNNCIKCDDGLVAFSPQLLLIQTENAMEKIKNIKQKSKEMYHYKYDELLLILDNPHNVLIPTTDDLRNAMISLDNNKYLTKCNAGIDDFLDRFRLL